MSLITVKNRSTGTLVYRIPEDGIRREFAPGEVKKIDSKEFEKLAYQTGGRDLIADYMILVSEEVLDELNIHREPEYYMSEHNIIDLMKNGSLDEFLDCLEHAPRGVIDLIIKFAVELPLADMNKVSALKEKTGFDALKAIQHVEEEKAATKETSSTPTAASNRRVPVAQNKYKVVTPKTKTTNN